MPSASDTNLIEEIAWITAGLVLTAAMIAAIAFWSVREWSELRARLRAERSAGLAVDLVNPAQSDQQGDVGRNSVDGSESNTGER